MPEVEEPSRPVQSPERRAPAKLFPWGILLAIPFLLGVAALPWCAR